MIRDLFRKRKRMNNSGFTIAELLVATAILSVIVVVVYSFMASSSRFYEKASADADIQMEAQLVANSISDLIIDCEVNIRYQKEVSEQVPDGLGSEDGEGAPSEEDSENAKDEGDNPGDIHIKDDESDPNDGKTLEIDNSDYQFLIINSDDDKLYYVERKADPATGKYTGDFSLANAELLAENVSKFEVDLSRLKGEGQENIVSFTLTYNKGKRSYTGIYQVNLRNQVTVNEVVTEAEEKKTSIDKLVMSPDVYVIIKGKDEPYLEALSQKNLTFNVSYKASNLTSMDNLFQWSVDSGFGYALPDPSPTGAEAVISLPDDFDFNTLKDSNFRITAQSNVTNKAGEKLTASAKVYFRKVQNVTVTPRSGIVNGEAAADSTVIVNGLVDGWNLESSDKYVTWKLQYYTDTNKTLRDCPTNVAVLGTNRTSSYIQLGSDIDETYHFKIMATSNFDSEWSGEYTFDIYSPPPGEYPDDACRGVEIDIVSYFEKYPDKTGQGNLQEIVDIENAYVQNVPGWDGNSPELFEIKVVDGRLKLYLNYEDYKYQSVMQLINYYDSATVDIVCTLVYKRKDNGQIDRVNAVLKLELEGTSINAGQSYPDGSAIVIPYGGSMDVPFVVSGYNITSKNQIGVYLNGDNVNANAYGMLDLNNFISANYAGALGSRDKLVKNGMVRLTSKSANPIRPVGATTVEFTVDDMYRLLNYMKANGTTNHPLMGKAHISYKVYVANVEDTNIYVPGPNDGIWTKQSIPAGGLDCSEFAPSKAEGIISIININGNEIYQLDYAGNIYYYNKTYHYWQKQ